MKAIGIVFLYDRVMGAPDVVAKEFSDYFPRISEDLVKTDLLNLAELKEIMDLKKIYWGGIKEGFYELLEDEMSIGGIALKIFDQYSKLKASDEVKSLIYDAEQVPWNFRIAVCVLYE